MTPLSEKLKTLIPRFPDRMEEINKKADELDKRNDELNANPSGPQEAKRVLGAWARARRLYCELTGEPLI